MEPEAIAFSTGPGQAITYQIGKLQITKFLAEGRMQQGEKFNLRAFHDSFGKTATSRLRCSGGNIWDWSRNEGHPLHNVGPMVPGFRHTLLQRVNFNDGDASRVVHAAQDRGVAGIVAR
jgi:hypothetical protein